MPVVDDVSVAAPSFSPPLEKTAPSAMEDGKLKAALTQSNGTASAHAKELPSDAVTKIKESLKILKASIQGDPLSDPRYVALLKLLRSALDGNGSANGLNSANGKVNGTSHSDGAIRGDTLQKAITGEQKKQLLAQIKAFRCLSRNLPVPSEVVLSMGTHTMNQPVRTNIAPFLCPPTLFRGGSVGNNELVASAVRDAMTVAQEREGRIRSKIQQRMEELKVLPTNIVPNLKKQAQIELKQLKLLELQKKIRSEISGEVKRIREFESAIDMDAYRKSDVTVTEEEVDIDSADGEQAKIAMQRKFFNALHYHAKEFKEFHLQKDKTMKKLTRAILQYHKDKEKREAAIAERKKRERIEYLRRNDVEAYEKLLEGVKDERLNMLMKQTGEFLATMGILVAKEKEQGGEKPAEGAEKTGTDAPTTSKTYYTEAHTIKEEIKEQPEMLVGGKLKEYQLAGVQWLVSLYNNKLNGILADEMGLGKTIQTIGLISYLMEKKGNNGPFMIAMPLSTVSNWSNEFAKWAPKINVVCYKGKPSERKQIYLHTLSKLKFNVVLVSFEYVMIDKNELGKIKWEYMILDEGHRIKNKNAKLSTTLRQYQSKHRLLLTGTPLQNDLGELWSLLNFLLPTIFNSVDNFENWFNSPFRDKAPTKKQAANLSVNEEESLIIINRLHQVLRPFLLRRLKSDVESQLPDKVERVLKCSLSAMQNVMYQQIATRGVMMTDPNSANYKRSTRGFNNVIMQLQKICNHPYLFRDEWDVDENMIRTSGKFELMDRMLIKLKATKHRVLIFTQMTHVITIMELYFDMRGFEYLRLDGQTKQEERATLVKEWNRPDSPYFLFVLSTHAGGLGLNLQTADTVIIFDTDWNPHMDLQAQDRAHRIGQTQEVRVFRLVVQNSLEEKILDRASYKLNIDAKIIQAGMFNNNASDEMRREMLEGLLRGSREDKDEDEVVTSNEQLNSALARNDAEFEKFQKMDEDEDEEWRKKNKKGERQSRLITFEELPKWMTEDPAERLSKEKEEENYGKGKRQRSEVNYDDGLTENQFLRMMEKGLSYEDVRTARAKRRDKKKGNQDSSDAGSDEEESGSDASQSQEPRKKNGEGKKVKKIHIKQKLDEFSEEEEEILDEMEKLAEEGETNGTDSKSKKGKRKKSDASELSPERAEDGGEGEEGDGEKPPKKKQKVELKLKINLKKENIAPPAAADGEKTPKEKKHKERKEGESGKKRGRKPKRKGIEAIYRNLWQTIRTATDESGRVLSALFMDLPSAEDYPDYYEVIEKPVCMSQIKRKKYALPAEFRQDFLTMFENAKEYNEATSQIYADASTLMRLFDEEFSKRQKELEAPEEPEAESGDDDDSSVANDDTPGGKKKRGRPKKDKSAKKEKRAREAKEKEEKEEKEGKGEKEEEENGEEEDDDEGDGVDA